MNLLDTLQRGLADLDAQGLRRMRRIADTACDARMTVDGREIVCFASNDYLGLAAHPALVAAFGEGAGRYGSGSGGSHLLGGHSRARTRSSKTSLPRSPAASPMRRARCTSAPATWRTSPR